MKHKMKMPRVLQVGASMKTRGGITTVLKAWRTSPFWTEYSCKWIETQDNRGLSYKIYYFISSFIKALFYVPSYDIVHFHTTPGRGIYVQMPIFLLSLLFRKKIVIQLHVGNQLNEYYRDRVFKWELRRGNRIIVLANVWKKLLIQKYSIEEGKISVLYNPAPPIIKTDKKEKYVLFMAYLTENKGYDVVIKAFSNISDNFNEWRLIMAGAGEVEKAKKLAIMSKNVDKIELRDWITGAEKEELLRHAGAFCMASYMEGFPMSVLDAWSHGVPLITTPVGGLPDVIRDGENALIFDFGDVHGLTECFNRLFSSEKLRTELSEASLQLVQENFSIGKISEEIKDIYNSL